MAGADPPPLPAPPRCCCAGRSEEGDLTEIRDAGPADLDRLVALDAALFGVDAWSPAVMAAELSDQETRVVLVAASGTELVGYAILIVVAEVADVQRIAVAAAAQRQGLGTSLLDALVDRAVDAGCERMLLDVSVRNDAAVELYRGLGFDELSRRPDYYRDGSPAIVMARELPRRTV